MTRRPYMQRYRRTGFNYRRAILYAVCITLLIFMWIVVLNAYISNTTELTAINTSRNSAIKQSRDTDINSSFCQHKHIDEYIGTAWYSIYMKNVMAIQPFKSCPTCTNDSSELELLHAKVCSRWWDHRPERAWEHSRPRKIHATYHNKSVQFCKFGQNRKPKDRCARKLETITSTLNKLGILYFPVDGTELGTVRDGGYLSTDGDIDLFIDFPATTLQQYVGGILHGDGSNSYGSLSI